MDGEVGTERLGGNEASEREKSLVGCVGAVGRRGGAKGHSFLCLGLGLQGVHFDAFSTRKRVGRRRRRR